MVRLSGFGCLILICSCYQVCKGNPFLIAKVVVEKGMMLYNGYQAVKGFSEAPEHQPSSQDIRDKLIALSADLQEFRREIMLKISPDLKDAISIITDEFFDLIADIQCSYETFLKHLHYAGRYENVTLSQFATVSTSYSNGELQRNLQRMYKLFHHTDISEESLLELISIDSTATALMCIKRESKQQLIYDLYQILANTAIKGTLITLYSYDARAKFENLTFKFEKEEAIEEFRRKMSEAFKAVKETMRVSSRKLWRCDPPRHIQGVTFEKLEEVFQSIFLYNGDTESPIYGRVDSKEALLKIGCDKITDSRLRCESEACQKLPQHARCPGHLRNCLEMPPAFQVCYSKRSESDPRIYDWVRPGIGGGSRAMYGAHADDECMGRDLHSFVARDGHHMCVCTCEREDRDRARYFSLQEVVADEGKVVTGAKLTKKGSVFHLQIMQGTIGPKGAIIDEPEWKEVPDIADDELYASDVSAQKSSWVEYYHNNTLVYSVTHDHGMQLDTFEARPGSIVTGLRFDAWDEGFYHELGFQVLTTPYDYNTGELDTSASCWEINVNSVANRKLAMDKQPDVPTKFYGPDDTISTQDQYVRFRMTDLEKDVGSFTVPFIDIQEVVTEPPMPLSGIGFIHRGKKGSGGFLAVEVTHYDYTGHL